MQTKKIHIGQRTTLLSGLFLLLLALFSIFYFFFYVPSEAQGERALFWSFQSIDTMKYSRDLAREKLNDPSFDSVIAGQMKAIASTGATHVAIATPYDEEFYPMLQRWVKAARREHLNVWFRGNFSGWEGWFSYPKITRAEHLQKTKEFLNNHPDIFANGDVFTPCPECENGGPGDPRLNGDVEGHRQFLIDEYQVTKQFFIDKHKNVASNYDSMNKDVATLVMDKETTQALDGVVTIDHYVESGEKLASDIESLSEGTGGKVVLGEFGAPIPDIHGNMTEQQQADWIKRVGTLLIKTKGLIGLNYWVNTGGSTQLWNENGTKRLAVDSLQKTYTPLELALSVKNELGRPVAGAKIQGKERYAVAQKNGVGVLPYLSGGEELTITAKDYKPKSVLIKDINNNSVTLERSTETPIFKLFKFMYSRTLFYK